MADPLRKIQKFTYSDYALQPDDKRYELIEGILYNMAPAPGERHQGVSSELHLEFGNYLRGKKCKVYHAPFDVAFPEKEETFETATNVVQPDMVIICDKEKITSRGCLGAPDLVVEILSPGTASHDLKDKRRLYQKFGVKEYWIVDPIYKTIQIYKINKEGRYGFPETYAENDKIKVGLFNNELEIALNVVFAE